MNFRCAFSVFIVALASAVVGCGTPAPSPSEATLERSVVAQLSAARCDQEEACHHVGDGAKFATRSVCEDGMRRSVTRDVESYRCPHGLDQDVAGRCVEDVRSEGCDHPFRSLSSYRSCRDEALCAR